MAKEPTTSRIPMPGLSRIPLPGSIRPPTNFSTARPAQILRPPATFLKTTRTQLFSGLRPPATPIGIKKSFSGDRISSLSGSTNMVTKKTAALKKFFSRPDCKTAENMQSVAGKYVATGNRNAFKPPAAAAYTPSAGLTRSATFVRDDSPQDMPQMQQLTPMPAGKHRPPMECESTPLLNVTNAKKYFMGENLDASPLDINTPKQRASILESTRISAIGFGNTMDIVSPGNATRNVIGNTVCYQEHDAEQPKDVTQNLEKCNKTHTVNVTSTLAGPECLGRTLSVITTDVDNLGNLTKTLYNTCVTLKQNEDVSRLADSDATQLVKATDVLGRTLCVITSNVDNLGNLTKTLHDSAANLNQNDDACRLLDFSDIHSPATNATYSNPGSSENLLLLDDVSIPSGFEEDEQCLTGFKPSTGKMQQNNKFLEIANDDNLDTTLTALAPNKANMKLPLNSTLNTERLLDLTMEQYNNTPARQMNLLNLTEEECMDETTPRNRNNRNTTQLLYMTQLSASVSTTPDRNGTKFGKALNCSYQLTPIPAHLQSPMLLKNAQSDLVLPTRTPDEDLADEIPMDVDSTLMSASGRTNEFFQQHAATSLQDVTNPEGKQKSRFSFGLDLTESTLDCSIELVDCSLSSTALSQPMNNSSSLGHHLNNISHSISSQQLQQQYLKKQNSFDLDESLGILTPDQMKEFLDSTATNNTGNHTNNNNLDLKLVAHHSNAANVNHISNKLSLHQLRMDQTPSPEELPLDPVEVKTGINNMVRSLSTSSQVTFAQNENQNQSSSICTESISLHTDTEPSKTDQSMNKSCTSKFSNSFITSVTSVTSLDTGYQGDGEMSRPASRGACDHSPSNGPLRKGVSRQPSFNQQQAGAGGQIAPVRRQDPMTDSDFFTESDADDVLHRGDRRAQVIDGQLYGPTLQPSASVFISEDPQMEDSCMESSGIFTDVENRGDEDLAQMRRQDTHDNAQDLSPDADGDDSTETVRSNKAKRADVDKNGVNLLTHVAAAANSNSAGGQGYLSSSQTSSTIQSSMSTDHLSAATTLSNRTSYCSVDGSVGVGNGMDFKSFSSFDEAFDGESSTTHMNAVVKLSKSSTTSTTSWCEQQAQKQLPAVQRITSPRKHASLSSLCTENGVHGAKTRVINSNNNNGQSKTAATVSASASGNGCKSSSLHDSLKSITQQANSSPFKSPSSSSVAKFSARSKTTPKVAKQSLYPNSNQSVKNKNNSSPSVVSSSSLVRKHHHSPNKWEAVMNQIANNKSTIKTNYSDVKSKVATRINMSIGGSPGGGGGGVSDSSKSVSPTARRSPTSVSSGKQSPNKIILSKSPSINGKGFDISALASKRLLQGPTTKRGRSYSKDSQKSSQSDISLKSSGANAGSPKLLAKTPLRAAKKRDVRNLSISPTDLGPPPKTQQTANGTSTRPKPAVITLTQKRFTSNGSSPTNCTSPSNNNSTTIANGVGGAGAGSNGKGSPSAKKFSLTSRRLEVKATPSSVKVPLKGK